MPQYPLLELCRRNTDAGAQTYCGIPRRAAVAIPIIFHSDFAEAASPGPYRRPTLTCVAPSQWPNENPSSLFGFADLLGRLLCRPLRRLCNAEVFELFAGFDCCREPARPEPTAGPGFARIFRIAVFGSNRASRAEPEPFGT